MIEATLEIAENGKATLTRYHNRQKVLSWKLKIADEAETLRRIFVFNAAAMPVGTIIHIFDDGEMRISDDLGIRKGGRPLIGLRPMSTAERQRRWYAKKKAARREHEGSAATGG